MAMLKCSIALASLFPVLSLAKENPASLAGAQPQGWPPLLPLESFMSMHTQWFGNFGYCGATSFIEAGLLFGQYVSQFTVRDRLTGHQSDEADQLLVGVNAAKAAKKLFLDYEEFSPSTDTASWAAWVQGHVRQGHPVVAGVLTNFRDDFFGIVESDLKPGSDEYDHIVTVVDLAGTGWDTYSIRFYDHGLWTGSVGSRWPDANPNGTFGYRLKDITRSRSAANKADEAYSVVASAANKYAIALKGPAGVDKSVARPVRVTTHPTEERPAIKDGSNKRPAASALTLSVTAYGLEPGTAYTVYLYNDFSKLPQAGEDPAPKAERSWSIDAQAKTSVTLEPISIMSNTIAIFRCYPTAVSHSGSSPRGSQAVGDVTNMLTV